jgi:hypothetical protein
MGSRFRSNRDRGHGGSFGWRDSMAEVTIDVRQSDGRIVRVQIAPEIIAAARALPHAPDRYFIIERAVLLPVANLLQKRARPEGIANAVKLMAAAYAGYQPRRKPIDVQPLEDGRYLVLDGNSTVSVAVAAGWPVIPCLIA